MALLTQEDLDQLRILSLFHYILAGLIAVQGCCTGLYFGLFVFMIEGQRKAPPNMPNAEGVQLFMLALACAAEILHLMFLAALVMAGNDLRNHRRHTFCVVMAAMSCLYMPIGTVLGVFTIIVLQRPAVKLLFAGEAELPPREDW